MRSLGPEGWLWIVGVLISGAAAVSLWLGAARVPESDRAAYRWLAGAALAWCAGAAGQQVTFTQVTGFTAPLTFADLFPLLALAPITTGILVLAAPRSTAGGRLGLARGPEHSGGQLLGRALDAYVMASALLVIGWVTLFGREYARSGADPQTFLLGLIRPLAGILAVSALLPFVAVAGRRVAVPYLALIAVTVGDSFDAAVRLAGGREPGGTELALKIVGYLLLLCAPWLTAYRGALVERRAVRAVKVPAAAIASALAAAAAAIATVASEVAGDARVQPVVIIAAGGAVLALAVRVLGLLSESSQAVAAARVSAGHVRDLADRTSDAVAICDLDGTVRYSSPSVAMYGYAAGSILGRNLAEFVHPEDRPVAARQILRITGGAEGGGSGDISDGGAAGGGGGGGTRDGSGAKDEGGAKGEGDASRAAASGDEAPDTRARVARFPCRVLAADGTWRHIECTVSRYQQPGEHGQLLITARDLSDQIALRQQVTHLIFHDRLTGLPNRAYFAERVADLLGRRGDRATAGHEAEGTRPGDDLSAELTGLQVAAVFLHLDGFSAVKDSAGHTAGDLLLTQAARRLRVAVPAQHTLARWGGAEFAVLVEAHAGAKEAVDLAEQLGRCIAAQPFRVSGRDVAVTASVGVAFAGDSPAGDVMRNADVALSRARAAGGGGVEIFAAHMHADIVRRLELTSDLQQAIAEERLTLEFQPIVELATARVSGVEALVRWWRGGERVPQGEFLRLAEESGLIVALGDWVLRESCGQLVRWRRGSCDIGVSVNFSLRQISAPGFVDSVIAALTSSGLPASALTIEIAEQVLVAQRGETARRLSELRRHGVQIAVDDFGTGYASLGSLRKLPVDIIKIDPSFVSSMGTDDTLTLLTGAIVRLGHDLGVTVVAEGVEHPRQLELLREMGCARGQGYLIARPMSARDVESLLAASSGGQGPDLSEQGKTPAPAS